MRRDFELREADRLALASLGLPWETIRDQGSLWLVIHDMPIPIGYTVATVSVALQIPANYPASHIDMAYFHPPIVRRDGKQIPASDSTQVIDGKTYQRWSRHYTAENPWRPEEDDVGTHLELVQLWLRCELMR